MFTQDEVIRGVSGLKVRIHLSPALLRPLADVTWKKQAKRAADDPQQMIERHFSSSILKFATARGKREFRAQCEEEQKFVPPGELVLKTQRKCRQSGKDRYFEIFRVGTLDERFQQLEMNDSLQAFFYFFIESCSFIQPDQHWSYFILYERTPEGYRTIAYSTLYEER